MPGYFTRINPSVETAQAYVELAELAAFYRQAGRTLEANQVAGVLRNLRDKFALQSERNARKAEAFIRSQLRLTQKRPDTPGPQHLRDKIVARPLPTTYPAGAIGIGDLDTLETAINPRTGGVYWRAQEYGLPVAMRGKPAPGYFMPGQSRPDPGLFRQHPYFEQMEYQAIGRGGPRGGGPMAMPALVRTRPVPARHYLRNGSRLAYQYYLQEARRIKREAGVAVLAV